ncbi:hypothetical protein ACQ4LE_002659, partial [Meloidogyne hapla]
MVTKTEINFSLDSDYAEQFIKENPDLIEIVYTLATNQTYLETISQLISDVNKSIELNRNKQEEIRLIQTNDWDLNLKITRKRMNLFCWPPYFKDSNGMSAGLNSEALAIKKISVDPLMEEGRRWNYYEINLLRISVCSSLKDEKIGIVNFGKEIIINKLNASGVEITKRQKQKWINEIERANKQIAKIRAQPENIFLQKNSDYSTVDWARISASDFKGLRSISQLRQKWCNELCPILNKTKWTDSEDEQLINLSKKISNWNIIAEKMGNFRSSFQCFQRFIYLRQNDGEPNLWKPKEDRKLIKLIKLHKIGDEIPWSKIAGYMPGRTKMSCEYRYTRTLAKEIHRGRWTEKEDFKLLEAVDKYGARNWIKVSECVQGRSALQCRNRWVHVLDPKRRDKPWTWEEHKRLFYFIRLFGRDKCAKIAKFLPGRNNMDVHMRIRFLVKLHIEKNVEEKSPVFRHFAYNYTHYKTRRKSIMDNFGKYLEAKQNDKKTFMEKRLGFGSFIEVSRNGIKSDNENIVKLRSEQFNEWSVIGSGRWTRIQQKSPNEQDQDERLKELGLLPNDQRAEVLLWLERSDARLEAEHDYEKQIPEDPRLAVEFYKKMFTEERIEGIFKLIEELIPPMEKDIIYFENQQNRCKSVGSRCRSIGPKKLTEIEIKKEIPIKKKRNNNKMREIKKETFNQVKKKNSGKIKEKKKVNEKKEKIKEINIKNKKNAKPKKNAKKENKTLIQSKEEIKEENKEISVGK